MPSPTVSPLVSSYTCFVVGAQLSRQRSAASSQSLALVNPVMGAHRRRAACSPVPRSYETQEVSASHRFCKGARSWSVYNMHLAVSKNGVWLLSSLFWESGTPFLAALTL